MLDAEEYDLVMRIKDLKAQYRDQHNELQLCKSEVHYTHNLVEQCAHELVHDFSDWYKDIFGVSAPGLSVEQRHQLGISTPASSIGSESSSCMMTPRTNTSEASASSSYPNGRKLGYLGKPAGKKKNVLSSLMVTPEDANDPAAAAYYRAQSVMYQPQVAVGPGMRRPGSAKKHLGERANTFGGGHV